MCMTVMVVSDVYIKQPYNGGSGRPVPKSSLQGKKLESAGKNMVREGEKRGAAIPPPMSV